MYRLGKKQKRAVLDSNGIEIVVFPKGKELYASLFVKVLNKIKYAEESCDFEKEIKLFKLFSNKEKIENEIKKIDPQALIEYELNKIENE